MPLPPPAPLVAIVTQTAAIRELVRIGDILSAGIRCCDNDASDPRDDLIPPVGT